MKRLLVMFLVISFCLIPLSGCFTYIKYPDMVEYNESEILDVIKEQFNIKSFIFTSDQLHGEIDTSAGFKVELLGDKYSTDFINPVNMKKALTSFAGKNGGHDIQGMYSYFLCYVALGINEDGEAKFIYYNTNIHKDAKIADTIGTSDYPYDILPNEITDDYYIAEWGAMTRFLAKFKNTSFIYSGDQLSKKLDLGYHQGKAEIKYYTEDGHIVFDLYHIQSSGYDKLEASNLVYSTSSRYGIIYNSQGFDYSQYIDVNYSVEPSTEASYCDLIKGTAKIKDFGKNIVYSQLSVAIEYYNLNAEGNPVLWTSSEGIERYKKEVTHGVLADRIEGIDHKETASFTLNDFYILYEK